MSSETMYAVSTRRPSSALSTCRPCLACHSGCPGTTLCPRCPGVAPRAARTYQNFGMINQSPRSLQHKAFMSWSAYCTLSHGSTVTSPQSSAPVAPTEPVAPVFPRSPVEPVEPNSPGTPRGPSWPAAPATGHGAGQVSALSSSNTH